jgi:hypothetical protein
VVDRNRQLLLCLSKIAIRVAQIRNSSFLQRTTDAAILFSTQSAARVAPFKPDSWPAKCGV